MTNCWGAGFPCEAKDLASSTIRLVALAIADTVNDLGGNEFYGSKERLAAKCGVHRDTVRLVVQHLTDSGVIEQVRERAGQTTVYRWCWSPRGISAGSVDEGADLPRGTSRTVPRPPRGTVRDKPKRTQGEPKPAVTQQPEELILGGDVGLTAAQQANRLMHDYWSFVARRSGRKPIGIGVLAFKNLVTPFLAAGVSLADLEQAVQAMYERGRTLTRQGIEQQLDGRVPKRNAKVSTMDGLRALQFDDAGMLTNG